MKNLKQYDIDKTIPIPYYYQLKKQIMDMIETGTLKVDDMLPTEHELSGALQISRPTIRQAMNELVLEGYLLRYKGKGTFVAKPKIDARFFQKLESFRDEMQQRGLRPSTKLLQMKKLTGSQSINKRLALPENSEVIYLERLRFADDEPIVYLETYLPYERFQKMLLQDMEINTLYDTLERLFMVRVVRAHREIEAAKPNRKISERLGSAPSIPACLVKTVAFAADDIPVEYSVAWYRGDRTRFNVDLYRE